MTNARDVLSEEEKDALMESVVNNQDSLINDDGVHRVFDFVSREHFALAQMKGLSTANERCCIELQKGLSEAFGLSLEVSLDGLEVIRTDDFMASIKNNSVINLIKLNLGSGKGLLVLSGELLSEIINKYFGSQFNSLSAQKPNRTLGTTESRINDRIVQLFSSALKTGWKDIADIELHKISTETTPEFVKIGEKDELCVQFNFDVSFGELSGRLEWLLPYVSIEPLNSKTKRSKASNDSELPATWAGQLFNSVKEVYLTVQVVMPEFEMNIGEVNALHVGSVIPLENPNTVRLCIEDMPFFSGDYGVHEDKKAMSLDEKLDPLATN